MYMLMVIKEKLVHPNTHTQNFTFASSCSYINSMVIYYHFHNQERQNNVDL